MSFSPTGNKKCLLTRTDHNGNMSHLEIIFKISEQRWMLKWRIAMKVVIGRMVHLGNVCHVISGQSVTTSVITTSHRRHWLLQREFVMRWRYKAGYGTKPECWHKPIPFLWEQPHEFSTFFYKNISPKTSSHQNVSTKPSVTSYQKACVEHKLSLIRVTSHPFEQWKRSMVQFVFPPELLRDSGWATMLISSRYWPPMIHSRTCGWSTFMRKPTQESHEPLQRVVVNIGSYAVDNCLTKFEESVTCVVCLTKNSLVNWCPLYPMSA